MQRSSATDRRAAHDAVLVFYGVMVNAYKHMSDADQAALHAWESRNLGKAGGLATSDWPRWREFIDFDTFWPWPARLDEPSSRPPSPSLPVRVRALVLARDGLRCRFCGFEDELTVDHVVARARGGDDSLENLQTLCRPCNTKKGTRSQEEFEALMMAGT